MGRLPPVSFPRKREGLPNAMHRVWEPNPPGPWLSLDPRPDQVEGRLCAGVTEGDPRVHSGGGSQAAGTIHQSLVRGTA